MAAERVRLQLKETWKGESLTAAQGRLLEIEGANRRLIVAIRAILRSLGAIDDGMAGMDHQFAAVFQQH